MRKGSDAEKLYLVNISEHRPCGDIDLAAPFLSFSFYYFFILLFLRDDGMKK